MRNSNKIIHLHLQCKISLEYDNNPTISINPKTIKINPKTIIKNKRLKFINFTKNKK